MQGYFLQLMVAGFIAALAHSQVATIRVSSNLVLTPVRITDADGKVVRDLKPEDFEYQRERDQSCGGAPRRPRRGAS